MKRRKTAGSRSLPRSGPGAGPVLYPVTTQSLFLANLTGPALFTKGADGSISTDPFRVPQLWAVKLHEHHQQVDGLLYACRTLNTERAVVVFDRARHKFPSPADGPLVDDADLAEALHDLRVDVAYENKLVRY